MGCAQFHWCHRPVRVRMVLGRNMVTTLIALAVVIIGIAVIRLVDRD